MKRIVHSFMRRLDLRLSRASSFERVLAEATASERRAAELESELSAILKFEDAPRTSTQPEESDAGMLERIPIDGSAMTLRQFLDACAAYSALHTTRARERISAKLLASVLAADVASPDLLLESPARSLASHELYRQAAATRAFASGLLDQSIREWKQISDDVPAPFNLACYARALIANNDKRHAFTVLADGVERFPRDVLLAVELSAFFLRLGDTDAANVALDAVRHAFLDERSALTQQQTDLDRDIDQGRLADRKYGGEPSSAAEVWQNQHRWQSRCTEFQNQREAAIRAMIARIVQDSKGDITTVIEFGCFCGDSLVKLARQLPQVQFIGLSEGELITGLNSRLIDSNNPAFAIDRGPNALTPDMAGNRTLLFHAGIEDKSYPAKLAQLYGRCRELGVGHLIIAQILDFDRDSLSYHDPGQFPRITRLGGRGRFLHDFKKLLDDAGYAIAEASIVPPGLIPKRGASHAGYRLLHAVPGD